MTREELAAVPVTELRDELIRRPEHEYVVLAILSTLPGGSGLQELVWAHKGFRYTLAGMLVDLEARLIADQRKASL